MRSREIKKLRPLPQKTNRMHKDGENADYCAKL